MSVTWDNVIPVEAKKRYRVKDFFNDNDPETIFLEFDLTDIQDIVKELQNETVADLAAADNLQRRALVGADICSEHIAKLVKIITYLDVKESKIRNKTALEFKTDDGKSASVQLRKFAADASEEAEQVAYVIAKAKGTKTLLEKKYEVLIKAHHFYKEQAQTLRKTI